VSTDRLAEYRSKRDFARTPEPSGRKTAAAGNRFVVQRHRARRRHYDLRLELGGALLSWAVPKGPTLDPKARHLAVRTEDHPLEYVDFEGVIPRGEYGAGDVVVWDRGTWEPVDDDPEKALDEGNLHFDLHGEKLSGRFVLVLPRRREDDQFLLLHKDDEHAVRGWDPEQHPESVKTGRTNDEVAAEPDAVWHSNSPPEHAEVSTWRGPTRDELAALDELGDSGRWHIAGHEVRLTNLDKVLFPAGGGHEALTKRDLVRYHARIAPVMLPHLADRALNLHRFPNGVDTPGFWHKAAPEHAPSWMRRWRDDRSDEPKTHLVADSVPALVWLANYAAIELHPWTAPTSDVEHPSWVLFDIDPGPETSFEDVLTLARLHRTALEHLGLRGCPKTTGQRGIQVWVPIAAQYTHEDTRKWAEKVSRAIGNTVPELVSWSWQKADRGGRARLDYTQNAGHKTLIAPYSARPRPGAPVSVPITWDELDDPELSPDRWTIRTAPDRVAAAGDPFAAMLPLAQELPDPA
jgi:bifunctional non-homologous end joining protein LigD